MRTLAQSAYLDSEFGMPQELSKVGSALENPFVYDSSAQELKVMAAEGLLEILDEHRTHDASGSLIDKLTFVRKR